MRRWAEITSFLIGATAAVVLLAGWRVPHGTDTLGANVRLSVGRSPVVELSRTGVVLEETHFRRGDTATARLVVTNPGTRTLRLRPQAQLGDEPALDRMVRIRVQTAGRRLFTGRLSGLGGSKADVVEVPAGGSVPLTITIRLPSSVGSGFAARSTEASLVLEESP
ncbi:MAG: hypothetical protein ACXWYS_02730 [Gaiellaceae bacterium]